MRFDSRNKLVMLGLLLAASCAKETNEEKSELAILEFVASPDDVGEGQMVTLSWRTSHAVRIDLSVEGAAIDVKEASPDRGSVQVQPASDSIYELIATDAEGRTVSRTASVTVRARQPIILAFDASPDSIDLGSSTTLTWRTTDVESVWILENGTAMELPRLPAPEGSVDVSPTVTTTYTLEATRGEFVARATVLVTVHPGEAPEITFIANAETIDYDSAVALEWTTKHAEVVTIAVEGKVMVDDGDPTGRINVFPARKTRYVLTATGPGGTSEASVTIAVRPRIESFEVVGAGPYFVGAPVTLRWKTLGADAVTISDLWGSEYVVPAEGRSEGEVVMAAPATSAFWITAQLDEIEVLRDTEIELRVEVAPGYLAITELMLDPEGGANGQWFEVRNLSRAPIVLDGLQIRSGAQVHEIAPPTPIALFPGKFATFAASASPGFEPTYVYGATFALDPSEGDLAITSAGTPLAEVRWDETWTISSGKSLGLDGTQHKIPTAASPFDQPTGWCESAEPYATGAFGTPGRLGSGCLTAYDVDFYSEMPFVDISFTGAELDVANWHGQWYGEAIPGGIPFSFPYFGAGNRVEVWPEMPGVLYFGHECNEWSCFGDETHGLISLFYDDFLTYQEGATLHYEFQTLDGKQVLIVQWSGFGRDHSEDGSLTFQAQLWEGGDVVLAYGELLGGDETYTEGSEAMTGLFEPWTPDWDDPDATFEHFVTPTAFSLGDGFADFLGTDPGPRLSSWLTLHFKYR